MEHLHLHSIFIRTWLTSEAVDGGRFEVDHHYIGFLTEGEGRTLLTTDFEFIH